MTDLEIIAEIHEATLAKTLQGLTPVVEDSAIVALIDESVNHTLPFYEFRDMVGGTRLHPRELFRIVPCVFHWNGQSAYYDSEKKSWFDWGP
jgi:hypothetical protein